MHTPQVALARRHTRQGAILTEHIKVLKPLKMSDIVLVQNQAGRRGKKWDRSCVVVEILDHGQYRIKVDGSGCTPLRNRRFLRPINPFNSLPNLDQQTAVPVTQPGQAGPGPRVQPGVAVHDQHVQFEDTEVQHSPDTVQSRPSDQVSPSQAPAEPVSTPALSSTPSLQSASQLVGYELGCLTLSRRGGMGEGR